MPTSVGNACASSVRSIGGVSRLLAGFFLLCCQATLWGQAADVSREGPAFTVFAASASQAWAQLYYLDGSKDAVKLAFKNNHRSAPVAVAGGHTDKPLVFGVERVNPATQEKTYVPVAEAKWPEAATRVLCVFAITGNAPPQVRVLALDDGLKAFPLRSARVLNATGAPLLGRVAGYDGEFPAGVSPARPYPVASDDPTKVGSFPLAFATRTEAGEARLVYSGHGEAWPLGRVLVVATPVPGRETTTVQIRTLVDAPPAPKAPSAR